MAVISAKPTTSHPRNGARIAGMKRNKKYELVDKTYELLRTHSPSELTIRMIADAAGCSSTVIYRHFENLDQLIMVASVRYLDNYIERLSTIRSSDVDPLDAVRLMWVAFGEEAFSNVEIFDLMFWGRYNDHLSECIIRYYQLFPDRWNATSAAYASVFVDDSIEERNFIANMRAAVAGYFSYDGLRTYSDIQCHTFHSLLIAYQDCYREPGKAEEGLKRFLEMYDLLVEKFRIK